MKHYYICEECGEHFDTMEGAVACEAKHREAADKKAKLEKEKKRRNAEIKSLVEKYVEDYKTLPDVMVSFEKCFLVRLLSSSSVLRILLSAIL